MEIDFDSLRQDLPSTLPFIEEFCQKHGYVRAPAPEEGRYPRIRVHKISAKLVKWIDFDMALDENGNRFKFYSTSLHYELAGGAFFDLPNNIGFERYSKHFTLFDSLRFSLALPKIATSMECARKILENWDEEYLKREGQRVDICDGRPTIIAGDPRYMPTQLEL